MVSEKEIIREISSVVESLSLKVEALQAKINELCRSTGECDRINKVNKDLASQTSKDK
tara:strand:+ start:226 stop:399 length:174 start_codon:yes stop_codon:yes gene_type:complete